MKGRPNVEEKRWGLECGKGVGSSAGKSGSSTKNGDGAMGGVAERKMARGWGTVDGSNGSREIMGTEAGRGMQSVVTRFKSDNTWSPREEGKAQVGGKLGAGGGKRPIWRNPRQIQRREWTASPYRDDVVGPMWSFHDGQCQARAMADRSVPQSKSSGSVMNRMKHDRWKREARRSSSENTVCSQAVWAVRFKKGQLQSIPVMWLYRSQNQFRVGSRQVGSNIAGVRRKVK